jgi:tetratricopeptide (TPR) repeat protein
MAVEMELLLATYVVQAAGGERASLRSALAIFQRASERARDAKLVVAGAKIDIVLAPMAKLVGEFELAGQALRRAADEARPLAPALSIEALRLAADFLVEKGSAEKASELLSEALEIATAMPPGEAKQTSAANCAEALAAIFRARKEEDRAVEMDVLARRLAAGTQ